MKISIGEKKVFGGAAPRHKWLKDYCKCGGMIGGIRASAGEQVLVLMH